jgi:transcriptional regulator with XRE-family HTH domain
MMAMEPVLEYPAARCIIPSMLTGGIGLIAIALQVGTGGAQTKDYYARRGLMGYAFALYEPVPNLDASPAIRTPMDDLSHTRAVLMPAITDLAQALGVSRQAVYDWQNGKSIGSVNAARLADLAKAADVFATEGLTSPSQLLRRPIKGGKTFFDLVREGGSAENAVRELVARVRRELIQRQVLAARLANRKRPAVPWEDYGSPILNETG